MTSGETRDGAPITAARDAHVPPDPPWPARLPGYLDPVLAGAIGGVALFDASRLAGERWFWPWYLMQTMNPEWDGLEPEAVFDAFDSDPQNPDIGGLLLRADRWPVFPLGLADGTELFTVLRNFPEDWGVDYEACGPGWRGTTHLAQLEGHYRGPALSWPELVGVARATPGATGITDPARRLLLWLPATADTVLEEDAGERLHARRLIASALESCGATGHGHDLADQLLAGIAGAAWHEDPDRPHRWCSGEYALRTKGGDDPVSEALYRHLAAVGAGPADTAGLRPPRPQ